MLLDDYQEKVQELAIYPEAVGLPYCILGLTGEAGEIANKYKKVLRDDGGELTTEKRHEMVGELGDVLWYVAALAAELGYDLSEVAQWNIDKLTARKERGTLQGSGDTR